jgi:hypothetical protein
MQGETTTATRRATIVGSVLLVLAIAAPAFSDLIWFDETGGKTGYAAFHNLHSAYDAFLGKPQNLIDFNNLPAGTTLDDQYAKSFGVTFQNTANGKNRASSGVNPAGGPSVENVTGYDGSYMPAGDLLYAKFDNDLRDTPFTIQFAKPIAEAGAFVGLGVQGSVHSLTVSVFSSHNLLLGEQTVESWLWEKQSAGQNYESFFALRSDQADIGRIEIRNNATQDFANALLIDNVAFGSAAVPESSTLVLLLISAGLLRVCQRGETGAPQG